MPVTYLLAKRILWTLYLLKDLVTDSPSCTDDINQASENIKKHLRSRLLRVAAHIIGDAFNKNIFNPTTEAHQLAVAIYEYDIEIFKELLDCVFSEVYAFGRFKKVEDFLNNFEDCGCIAESYCVYYNYATDKMAFKRIVNKLLDRSDLDEDDAKRLNELLETMQEEELVPFIQLATNKIRPAIKHNKFGTSTSAHMLAVRIHNFDRALFREVFYNVFKTMDSYKFYRLKKSLDNFQNLNCKVDSYFVLYDDMELNTNYVAAVCDLFERPEADKEKLCALLIKIADDYSPNFPNSSLNNHIKNVISANPINSPGSILQVGSEIFSKISKVVDGDQYFAAIEESIDKISDYDSAQRCFHLLCNNISGITNVLWKFEQKLRHSHLTEFPEEKINELLECIQKCSVEFTRHLSILQNIDDM